MAEFFSIVVRTINYHFKQIDESGEIHLSDTIRKIRIHSDNSYDSRTSGETVVWQQEIERGII